MNDVDKYILELIKSNLTLKEISVFTHLSYKQLYIRLKNIINNGYQLKPNYYYDGNIIYKLEKGILNNDNRYKIIIPKKESNFKFLVISDLHINNQKQNLEYINKVYEYAINNNIHTILNVGDLIEGTYTNEAYKEFDINDQINNVIKKYPYDKEIINYILYGNHDYHSLHTDGVDVARTIENARYDMVSLGYGDCNITLKDDQISLNHKLMLIDNKIDDDESKVTFVGHGHEMKIKFFNKLIICVPSLSDVSPDKTKKIVPGALECELDFKKNKISYILIKHLLVNASVIECSQIRERFENSDVEKIKNYKK